MSAQIIAGPAGKHAVLRWYPVLDLSSRADRLLFQFHPARHESIVDVPHPHPAIPARQRICIFDRFADVSNAHGSVSTGFFPMDLRALWTVRRGTKIKFPIPPKQRSNEHVAITPEELVQHAWLLYFEKRSAIRAARAWMKGTIMNLCKQEIQQRCLAALLRRRLRRPHGNGMRRRRRPHRHRSGARPAGRPQPRALRPHWSRKTDLR